MEDLFDELLFGDDLSPEARSSIRDRFDEDPDLAAAWAHWCEARRQIRAELQERLPDRQLLVLYVLDEDGEDEALTARERAALDDARDDIARALDAIPALEQVVERIREERADFDEVWATHVEGGDALADASVGDVSAEERASLDEAAPPDTAASPDRPDRAARPPRSREEEAPARRWSRRLAVAFTVVALAAVAFLFLPQGGPSTTTVTVADGSVQVETLADGSTVRLVGPATLSHPTGDAPARRVTLEDGRAFFDVPPREDASFVVQTPTATATVLGTQFGVTTQADTTDVVLATGSVRVNSKDTDDAESVVLEPGQRSRVTRGTAPAAPAPADLTAALDWTGLFVFRSVPLDTIAEHLQARYDAQVAVAAPLRRDTVTGTFDRQQPVEEVLNTLAATLGAEVREEGDNRYRLVPTP